MVLASVAFFCFLASDRQAFSQNLAERSLYLDDLMYRQEYAPAKNSFIIQRLRRGERRTLLDIRGSGSIRHIWSTWARSFEPDSGTEPGKVLLQIFLDGEKSPSISGTIDEIFEAAERTGQRFVPQPAFNYEGAYNLYLPIFFQSGLRVEIESLDDLEEFYTQIDYRTTPRAEAHARLVSERTGASLTLKYVGLDAPHFGTRQAAAQELHVQSRQVELKTGAEARELEIQGPAIIRQLTFEGSRLDELQLSIFWDDERTPSVSAPLKYFFDGFKTLALDSQPGRLTCYFPMPFRQRARIRLQSVGAHAQPIIVHYALDRDLKSPESIYYFHALFHEEQQTTGYRDVVLLGARGEGNFVGINLFDSGHNHGGGDTALIDAETRAPRVLHGVAGEDYFSFAWHKTGRMHLMAGAPVHERRYRFHLENPYPFRTSLRFTFGIFAGLQPKSVAFWYQKPGLPEAAGWLAPDVPWKVLGPFDEKAVMPEKIDERVFETEVAIAKKERLSVRWVDAEMRSGFLDLTHHYRHYLMTTKGTGFVAGACQMRAITHVYSPTAQEIEALIGHDDAVEISVNHQQRRKLPAHVGFQPSLVRLKLDRGWNEWSVLVDNRENTDWRWLGFSLALKGYNAHLRRLKFSSDPEQAREPIKRSTQSRF